MKKNFILFTLFALSFSALAEDKAEQCLLVRNDGKNFDLEVPAGIAIRTKDGWATAETPKKILPAQFRQVGLTPDRDYSVSLILHDATTGKTIPFSVTARAYVKNEKTQEFTYYSAEPLPTLRLVVNGAPLVINGNKFSWDSSFELHVAPCAGTTAFVPAASLVTENTTPTVSGTPGTPNAGAAGGPRPKVRVFN